jgi:hypothetical protein
VDPRPRQWRRSKSAASSAENRRPQKAEQTPLGGRQLELSRCGYRVHAVGPAVVVGAATGKEQSLSRFSALLGRVCAMLVFFGRWRHRQSGRGLVRPFPPRRGRDGVHAANAATNGDYRHDDPYCQQQVDLRQVEHLTMPRSSERRVRCRRLRTPIRHYRRAADANFGTLTDRHGMPFRQNVSTQALAKPVSEGILFSFCVGNKPYADGMVHHRHSASGGQN